ncbi:unnamed protein product [Ranitomeya imitator]|uniref:Cation efflux protein transmembrane domain-containing protein n=1 Tax=Ranitomeya imitator TaxID=111125 RepID=A0ABN9LYK5_9NEOB|nr:unnamed protein product [Ranitomeya imitator]
MDIPPSICIPSNDNPTGSHQEDKEGEGKCDPDSSTILAQEAMDLLAQSHVDLKSMDSPGRPGSPVSGALLPPSWDHLTFEGKRRKWTPKVVVQFVRSGYIAHSLAIMTDAAHLLTDFASMMISLFALWMSSRPATKTMNFGWHRAEILGALLSVLSIWVVTGVLVYLAVERTISGNFEIEGEAMLITSGCAVAVNIMYQLAQALAAAAASCDPLLRRCCPSSIFWDNDLSR